MDINLDVFKKVLEKAIFGPLGVHFNVKTTNRGGMFSRDEHIEIKIFVDLEKFMPVGNDYNPEYEDSLYSIEDTLEYGLAILGLKTNDVVVFYDYVKHRSIDGILEKMTKELQYKVSDEFEVPINELQDLKYYFYGAESEGIYIRIECDFYELPDSIDKTRAEDIAKDIFYNQKNLLLYGLSDTYDLDILD
jgi:hypothetical protein|tara:strand:- start:8559 stop:9131 length:573 start_codon:yes stop_codon:yes gene_type:complete